MPREAIAMTRDELLAFLGAQRWVALGTLDPDGTPVGELAPVVLDGERLCLAVPRGSRADDNIRRDPRVCCAADEFPSYYEIRGATVHGRADRVEDGPTRARLAAGFAEAEGPAPSVAEGESELYWLPLDDVFSFDFGKIRNKF